jgi:hypothetical protein
VAEDVEKVNPDLVVRDQEGKPCTVRYEQVNAMLLNEFLREHCKVQEQDVTIAQVRSTAAKHERLSRSWAPAVYYYWDSGYWCPA